MPTAEAVEPTGRDGTAADRAHRERAATLKRAYVVKDFGRLAKVVAVMLAPLVASAVDSRQERETESPRNGSLFAVPRDEDDVETSRVGGAFFHRYREMDRVERSQPVLEDEPARGRQHRAGMKLEEGDRSVRRAVLIESPQQVAPRPHSPIEPCRAYRARELDTGEFARDDRFGAFEQPGAQQCVVGFVGKVRPEERTGVGVKEAQRRLRSAASAALAADPVPRRPAITVSRGGGRRGGRNHIRVPVRSNRSRSWLR